MEQLEKLSTGIEGLDEIMDGGFPRDRAILICGSAGCGKTILATSFIMQGARLYDETGVIISFEENLDEVRTNVASFCWDVDQLIKDNKVAFDFIDMGNLPDVESGSFNLDGLFLRLELAIDRVKAKRVVIDAIESLFSLYKNEAIIRSELHRLFRWLKEKEVTLVITGEKGIQTLSKHGIEEYVADCVISLEHQTLDGIARRRLRVVKYRGSAHGSNSYPFLISKTGVFMLPVTELDLDHQVTTELISTGIPALDQMLGGKGYYRCSNVLVSGMAGTGKSTLTATFAHAAAKRGERALYFSFEESPHQLKRNFGTVGLDFEKYEKQGLFKFACWRVSSFGLEMHLLKILKTIKEFKPSLVVIDPISNMSDVGTKDETKSMLIRIIDHLKKHQITGVMTDLTKGGNVIESTDAAMSSLMDTWLLLNDKDYGHERIRSLYVLKSRGQGNSNQDREILITSQGVQILPICSDYEGRILRGSERMAFLSKRVDESDKRKKRIARLRADLERTHQTLQVQTDQLQAEFGAKGEILEHEIREIEEINKREDKTRQTIEELAESAAPDQILANIQSANT